MVCTKSKMKKRKHDSFAEFILNDDKIVMKLLLTIAKWFGPLIFTLLAVGFLEARMWGFGIFFGIFALLGWWQLIKFYRLGGSKNLV